MANVPRGCDCPCHQTLGDAIRCDGERCYCGNVRKALGGQQVKDAPVMATLLHENRQLRARLEEHRGALELAAKSAKLADENKLLREEAATFEAVTDDWEREVQRYRRHLGIWPQKITWDVYLKKDAP